MNFDDIDGCDVTATRRRLNLSGRIRAATAGGNQGASVQP